MNRLFAELDPDEIRPITIPRPTLKVFRSRDWLKIRELCTHPRIFPHISDDWTADALTWQMPESDQVVYLLAADDDGVFGFAIFIPDSFTSWKAHIGFLPRSYGGHALTAFKQSIDWMWQHTRARRLVGEVARGNRLAIRFARRAGFSIYGINKRSKLIGGELVDQVCLGISKPE